MTWKLDYKKRICPNCRGVYRYLFRLSDKKNTIVFICEECTSIWIDKYKINWGDSTSDELLIDKFKVDEIDQQDDKSDEKKSGWIKIENEINRSEWDLCFMKLGY